MLGPMFCELRSGFRTLRGAPWFSVVTILTLALGIGASVAMFGVLNAVFLEPLPFPDPQQLIVGRATFGDRLNPWVAGADYYDYRDGARSFQELGAILPFPMEMTESGRRDAQRVRVSVASPDLLPALGVSPAQGRGFSPQEGLAGGEDVVLLTHTFWANSMGADSGALGSTLTLDGNPFTIIGILPEDFFFLTPADIWIPMRPDRMAASSRGNHNWYIVGRLREGTSLAQGQDEMDAISARLSEEYPETNAEKALRLTPLRDVLTEDYRRSLWLLSGAVALVLLIACGNGAGILLARAPTRRFELSIRAAIGAPRGRLIRQLLSESLLLSLSAGILGTLLAIWFQGVMLQYLSMERLGPQEVGVSPVLLGGALGISLLSGILAGLYPALRTAKTPVTEGLRSGNRGSGDGGSAFRSGLVVIQVALSIVLLVGSGLLLRSLSNLQHLDPGFDASGILTAEIPIPSSRYPSVEEREQFFAGLWEELRAMPGVEQVALSSHLPIGDFGNIYRASAQGSTAEPVRIFLRAVFPGYFGMLNIPLLSGRDIEAADGPNSPWVVVLSRTAAQQLFPEADALGRVVELPFSPSPRPAEVVGIVGDVRLSRLEEEPEAAVYVPYAHHARNDMRLALRADLPAATMAGELRETLLRMDPGVPLSRVVTLESLVSGSLSGRRILTLSLTLLALLPLLLASVGLFAVLAYHVSRRSHEMGVRIALGARVGHVSGMVLGQGLRLVAAGVALGVAGAAAGTRLLQGLLIGVEARDPLTFLVVAGVVMGVAAMACAVPVWRASRTDPRVVLQAE